MNRAIEHWDDERGMGNGIIVTLHYGWSFEYIHHEGVRGFDTVADARRDTAIKRIFRCPCDECNN